MILSIFNSIVKTIIAINPTVQHPLRTIGSKAGGQNPFFQNSSIPAFQYSNWGEAPNLGICSFDTGVFADLRQLFKVDKKWGVPGVLI